MTQRKWQGMVTSAMEQPARRLLAAARQVFGTHGLGAGVEEVALSAGVGIGTFYRRFPSKDALIAELVREFLQDVVALARSATAVLSGEGLEQFLYAMAAALAANRGCVSRMWSDDTMTAFRNEAHAVTAELLIRVQKNHRIRAEATLTDMGLLFFAVQGVVQGVGSETALACRRQVALTIAGLCPSSHPLPEPAVNELHLAR